MCASLDNTDKSFPPHSTLIKIDPDVVCIFLSYFEVLLTSPRIQSLPTRRQTMRATAWCPLAAGKVIFRQVVCDSMSSETDFPEITVKPHQEKG